MDGDELIRTWKTIKAVIRQELRAARSATSQRVRDPRKEVIARLIADCPKITAKEICHEMDKRQARHPEFPKYRPLHTWPSRLWSDAYKLAPNRVKTYISKIRRDLTRYLVPE